MRIDEAILIMENERPHCGEKLTFTEGELCEAYTLAIDALKALASAQPEPCEDTVSRQRLLSDLKELVAAWKKYPVMAKQIKGVEAAIEYVEAIPSAQPKVRPIDYQDCSNAMLKMWMDNVVTDGEYNRILDKLNAHWGKKDDD